MELPPLPPSDVSPYDSDDENGPIEDAWYERSMTAYARQAVQEAREEFSKIVVTKNESGQIVAVTRQDMDGRILSVIAESAPIEAVAAAMERCAEICEHLPVRDDDVADECAAAIRAAAQEQTFAIRE